MKNTSITALGGIITALSVFVMFLSGVLPFLEYTLPALAGVLLLVMVKETEKKWSFMVYAAVSIISLIVVSNKEAAIMYVFFFGYYTVLKELIEEKTAGHKALGLLLKLLVFNAATVLAYVVLIYIFAIPIEEFEEYGKYSVLILLALGNVTFLVYDFLLTSLGIQYDLHWHGRFAKIFK